MAAGLLSDAEIERIRRGVPGIAEIAVDILETAMDVVTGLGYIFRIHVYNIVVVYSLLL